jgi:lipoprotein-releasing system permease protein
MMKKRINLFLQLLLTDKIQTLDVAGFIANRIAFNRQNSFSRFIIRLSTGATIVSVAVMIITLALVNGFQETVSNKVFSFSGHIRVQYKQALSGPVTEEVPIERDTNVEAAIKSDSRVKNMHPYATRYSILKSGDAMEGVLLKGFNKEFDVNLLKPFLKDGRWINFKDSTYAREVIISDYTAKRLKVKTNDSISIYFIRPNRSLRGEKINVAGIYKTGIDDYDKQISIGDLKLIRRLNDWNEKEIGGYEVFLHDFDKMEKTSDDLYALPAFPQTWDTQPIRSIYPNIFDWLNLQNLTRNVLIGFMVLVAVINLITCLIILVLERIRMVGVLKALGATDWVVQKIFLRHSIIITLIGIFLGTIVGLGLLYLQKTTGFIKLNEEAYYMSEAAVKIIWWQVLLVCVLTFLVSLLILMIPTYIVKKVKPVKAIQFR